MYNNEKLNPGYYPLSLSQQDIYFDQLHFAESPKYNIGGYVKLVGINQGNLVRAFAKLINSQNAFGIRIHQLNDGVAQSVSHHRNSTLTCRDLQNTASPEQEAKGIVSDILSTSFSLYDSELYQFELLQINQNEYWFVICMHHLISDGVGIVNLIKLLGHLYNSPNFPLPELHPAWLEHLSADQNYLTSKKFKQSEEYWKAHTPPSIEPILPKRYFKQNNENHSQRDILSIPRDTYQKMAQTMEKDNIAMPQAILALLYLYFWKMSLHQQLVFGLPSHNRKSHLQKEMLNSFTNVSLLSMDITGSDTLIEFADKIRKAQKQSYRHQKFPFGYISRNVKPSTRETPLFDVSYNYLDLDNKIPFGHCHAELFFRENGYESTPLVVTVWDIGQKQPVEIQFEYNLANMDQSDAQLLMERFEYLFSQACLTPCKTLSEFSLFTENEQTRLLNWNNTQTDYEESLCVQHRLERHGEKHPQRTAVVFEDQQLTYSQLNARVNKLAHYLLSLPIQKGEIIGLCLPRSMDMLIAALGVMKAGATYLPLDPGYPENRLKGMLEESQCKTILALNQSLHITASSNRRVVNLDSPETIKAIKSQSQCNSSLPLVLSDTLAYVLFTSGSTGRPKGVCISHRALHNLLESMHQKPGMSATEKLLAITSIGFDISGLELFLPLICAGELHIANSATAIDSTKLAQYLVEHKINLMQATPSTWSMLVNEPDWKPEPGFKALCGGEAMPDAFTGSLLNRLNSVQGQLWNMYGPTETTIWSATSRIVNEKISIGQPINNTQFHILDKSLEPVGIDCQGELYIGGHGLAQGYLNRPELTEQNFIPNPFSIKHSHRLYRTGDLVKWNHCGQLEYIGRKDQQVKIRGHRIELGDVESQLAKLTDVSQCVVLLKGETLSDKQLQAFIVSNSQIPDHVLIPKIKQDLLQQLPAYMVPAHYILLQQMPLMPNGKIDRKALLNQHYTLTEMAHTPPENETQRKLCQIWQHLLTVNTLGITDNFFELGGHSLHAQSLRSTLRKQFHVDVPLSLIFEKGQIQDIAAYIDSCPHNTLEIIPAPLAIDNEIELSQGQKRLWFQQQIEGINSQYNMFAAFTLEGTLNVDALSQSFYQLIQCHQILTTAYQNHDGLPNGRLITPESSPLEVMDLTLLPHSQQQEVCEVTRNEFAQAPFDLSQAPLIRAKLIIQSDHTSELLINMHHIKSDALSVNILCDELAQLYRSVTHGMPVPVTHNRLQFSDYARWQNAYLASDSISKQMHYWREQLQDLPQRHNLPEDIPDSESLPEHSITLPLDQTLYQDLNHLAQTQGLTLFMLMQSCLAILLYRYSHSTDIVIGSPVSGRENCEFEHLIGFFVNTLVLRSDLTGDPALSEFLQRNKQMLTQAYANQGVPFDMLVDELKPERSLKHAPLFQILFSMQTEDLNRLQLEGINISAHTFPQANNKFDLMLTLQEQQGKYFCCWQYNNQLFHQHTIQRLADSYLILLGHTLKSTSVNVSKIPLNSEEQIKQLCQLHSVSQPAKLTLIEKFESQVTLSPDATAVVCHQEQMSYRELNARANQLAHYLLSHKVGPGDVIAIAARRSVSYIIVMLASLKVGAGYLPLTHTHPEERLRHMLADSGASFLISHSSISHTLCDLDIHYLNIDSLANTVSTLSAYNPKNHSRSARDIAYIIYTSGSTGTPKGVAVSDSSIINLAVNNPYFPVDECEAFLSVANFSFDGSVFDIYTSLLNGKTLVIATEDEIRELHPIIQLIQEHKINGAFLPTALFNLIVNDTPDILTSLTRLIIGGEAISTSAVSAFFQRFPTHQLINGYGPTETTVFATSMRLSPHLCQMPVIGQPIGNTQAFVMDSNQNLAAEGAIGELYISGNGLARNYINNPELTAEKFPDIVINGTSVRAYRTGDIVRWMPDGNLVFLGRIDKQVKIRGFRIELEEVEQHLSKVKGVGSHCVLVHERENNQAMLIAHLALINTDPADKAQQIETVRNELNKQLPGYMIPDIFMLHQALPLTINGKIDRHALSQLPIENEISSGFQAPQSELEQEVTQIFAKLLDHPVEHFSTTSGFFEFGGNSLIVVKLVNQLQQKFDIELNVKDVFDHATPKKISILINERQMQNHQSYDDILNELQGLSDAEIENMLTALDYE